MGRNSIDHILMVEFAKRMCEMRKIIFIVMSLLIFSSSFTFAAEITTPMADPSQLNRLDKTEQWMRINEDIMRIKESRGGITLIDFAEIINRERPITYDNYEYYRSHIKDTSNRDVVKLYSEGIIQGDGKGNMRADRFLNEVEINAMLSRMENPLNVTRPAYVRRSKVPILAYHEINEIKNGLKTLYVHPQKFVEQLDAIRVSGYNTVTMEQVYAHWKEGKPLPEKPIVLSFDDGYDSHFNFAAKELGKRGMVGSFYLITSHIGDALRVKPYQVVEMYRDGMEIGPHTVTHMNARLNTNEKITEEYKKSKEDLERILGVKIEHFCYPFGGITNHAMETLKSLGFKTSVVTTNRKATNTQNILRLERINVDYGHTTSQILSKIK